MSMSLPLIIGIGALVGLLSGLLGVGGGFLQTPCLMIIGIPPTVATASGATAIIATSSSGTMAHFRLGNVDFKLGLVVIPGGLIGALIGVHIIKVMRALGDADLLILLAYIILLGSVGTSMFIDNIRTHLRGKMTAKEHRTPGGQGFLEKLPLQTMFHRAGVRHSIFAPFAMGVLVGTLTAIMGVGGGFLMVPMMVYLLGVPAHVAVGTDLFQILITCSGVAMLQATENQTVDVLLVVLLAAGSTFGAQVGARLSRMFRGEQLLLLLATLILVVFVKLLLSIIMTPSTLLNVALWLPLISGLGIRPG